MDSKSFYRKYAQAIIVGGIGVLATLSATLGASEAKAQSAAAAQACDYYIAPTGSDSGSGSYLAPWKTVAYASAKLKPGQALCARGGTYYGQAGRIWRSSGTATAPVTFRNYPGEKPVFDGQWGDTGTEGDFLIFTNISNVVVDGLTIQRFADQYGNGTIDLHNGSGPVNNIVIQNCTMQDNGSHTAQDHHIYIAAGSTNTTIRNNTFIRAAGSAIQSYHTPTASGIRIYNNVMIGGTLKCSVSKSNPCSSTAQQSWGIMISDAKDTQIYNNTIYGMARAGIEFNYGTVGTGPYTVKNNLLVNNKGAGIRVTSLYAAAYTGDYNGFSGNASDFSWKGSNMSLATFKSSTGKEKYSLNANPSFVDAAAGDFRLNSNSPVINKGVVLSLFNTDKNWAPRPSGSSYEMGAYEFASVAPSPTPTPAPSPSPRPSPSPSPSPSATAAIVVGGNPSYEAYSVAATTTAKSVSAVQFYDNGKLVRTERSAPYCLTPEGTGVCLRSKLGVGTHNLVVKVLAADGKVLAQTSKTIIQSR